MRKSLSYEYIRGLVEGEGCFTFCGVSWKDSNGVATELKKLPTFTLRMNDRDKELLVRVKQTLKLRNRIYQYEARMRDDGYNRGGMAILMVRDFGQLKNIIIPLFYKKLRGNKDKQFTEWLEKIGSDPQVPESYKLLYKLHKWGYYDRHPKFLDLN